MEPKLAALRLKNIGETEIKLNDISCEEKMIKAVSLMKEIERSINALREKDSEWLPAKKQ